MSSTADHSEDVLDMVEQCLDVGDYTITTFGDDYWIAHKSGEGMQVFRGNFERLIDEYYRSEF